MTVAATVTNLQAYGRGTNLHALWDSGFIGQWPGGAASLQAAVDAAVHPAGMPVPAHAWAEESCRVVSAEGFYPQGHKLGDDYPPSVRAVLVQQLAIAGSRLAAVLNRKPRQRLVDRINLKGAARVHGQRGSVGASAQGCRQIVLSVDGLIT